VRTLLQGEEVDYTYNGETRDIRFLHLDLGFIELASRIPIYVAGNNPRVLRAAGEYGDGLVFFGDPPDTLQSHHLRLAHLGAEKAGRAFPENFHAATFSTAVLLKPGEPVNSERVIDECGSMVACILHYAYEIYRVTPSDDVIPPHLKNIWGEYLSFVEKMKTPKEKRYQQIHNGHCTFLVPEERRFMTPEAIKGSCMVGESDEILDQVRRAEKAGLKELTLLPPMASARKVFKDFADHIMTQY
jgi:alkanesulfonate monooxygenase SsuD/methylene tetrahydromethanopterin reductase-like flavin-dependent oxidoreductase (luciferase family)